MKEIIGYLLIAAAAIFLFISIQQKHTELFLVANVVALWGNFLRVESKLDRLRDRVVKM